MEPPFPQRSAVFSREDGLDIELDYMLPAAASRENPAPILLWWHGGGLLQGTRKACWPHLRLAPEKHGLCFVSADYRLAPQTRLPGVLSDVAGVMAFLRSSAFANLTEGRVDASRIIVSGGSAGGWLALLAGLGVGFAECGLEAPAPPAAICAIYPISDLLDPFWTTKQHPVSYMNRVIPDAEMAAFVDPAGPKTSMSTLSSPRAQFYHYMVQEGILADLLLGGTSIPPAAFSIAPAVRSGKVVATPPTFLTHGSIDDKVPFRQSQNVYDALKEAGATVEMETREGADHLFDMSPDCTMDAMYNFIAKVLL